MPLLGPGSLTPLSWHPTGLIRPLSGVLHFYLICRCDSEETKSEPSSLSGEWGSSKVSQAKWEVEEVEDKLGAMVLQVKCRGLNA